MKIKLFILIAIFLIGCSSKRLEVPNTKKEVVFEDYFTSKKPALFEHYYMFQQYSNYQMPILSIGKIEYSTPNHQYYETLYKAEDKK